MTYALATRLGDTWIEARVTQVARVSAGFSKSLARRRLRPNQEKVRSKEAGRKYRPTGARRRVGAALMELRAMQPATERAAEAHPPIHVARWADVLQ